jgi:phosphoribosylformimino-5-aminoimidazole carboxamide ribotide isomerase
MIIIPAIDLIKGQCVRLIQGEYHRQINYGADPAAQAQSFIDDGAQWLHIVDLEGAKVGRPVNTESIKNIAALGKLNIEVGGGIRDEGAIAELLDLGVTRVIIGTKALNDFEWFSEMAEKFANKIVLGLDARGTKIATHGWTKEYPTPLLDFVVEAAKLPLAAIIYTDISKDGMMAGPNVERTAELARMVKVPVVASGGVHNLDDIRNLKDKPEIGAAIVGRALYEKTINLAEAIQIAKR